MPQSETVEAEKSLLQIRNASKVIYCVLNSIFILCCLFLLLILVLFGVSEIVPDLLFDVQVDFLNMVTLVCTGIFVTILFKLITNVFRDVAKGSTPFTLMQVRRIRIAALIIALDALVGTVFSPGFIYAMQVGGINIGYTVIGQPSVPIDLGEILTAICLFCLSFVFKYGVLLQRLSDETL